MYGWIWRKLPLGVPGKIGGFLLLFGGAAALLWFFVFPAAVDLMPGNQSTITDAPGGDGDGGGGQQQTDENGVPSYDPSDFELESSPPPSEE